MAHIDIPERAALVKNKWTVLWIATGTAFVILLVIGAINFAMNEAGKQTSAGVSGSVQRYPVGERDEVEILLPPRAWANICTDKSVIVRVDSGIFRLEPPCKVFGKDKNGNFVPAATMGDNTSGVYHVKAAPGVKMAEVTVSSVRK